MQLAKPSKSKGKGPIVLRTIGDKDWLSRRLDEVGLSQRDAIRRMQWHQGSLSKRMQGETRWKLTELTKLAELLMVSLPQLMWRVGINVPVPQTAVIGSVKGDGRVWLVTEHRGVTVPSISDDLAVKALLFEVEKGPLRGYDGHALHYKPSRSVRPETFGALSVIEVTGEPTPVVGTIQQTKGKVCVTLLTGEVISNARVLSAAVVEGIRRPVNEAGA